MGRNNPATPGSRRAGEWRISTGAAMSSGALARIAARILSHPRKRSDAMTAKPIAQAAISAAGIQSGAGVIDVNGTVSGNACAARSIAKETALAAICFAGATRLPMDIRSAKGSRNFSDALNQIQ